MTVTTRTFLPVLLGALVAVPAARATIIPAERLPPPGTWESAGVEGGIPDRQVVCATVTEAPYGADATGAVSAVAAIQGAIDDCPDGQVVDVPAGRYLIDDTIAIRSSVTLRGAGPATVFDARTVAVRIGGLGPWPPPKNNPSYSMSVSGATRGSTTVTVADAGAVEVGKMVMLDEVDDPALVWARSGGTFRSRASMHLVESKTATTVTFRPALPIDYARSPQLSRFPDLVTMAGVEKIKFDGAGGAPGNFIELTSTWNCWVYDCEFTAMPAKTLIVDWSGHFEVRKNYAHHQTNGGPNSEGIDLLTDCNWGLVVDNLSVEAGFPQINIGDAGAGANYSGGFGNVIAYNLAVDAYYTDPPTSTDHGKMCGDISTNHSPHTQFNLVEGNVVGKFSSDGYHGSGSHTVLLRNLATGRNKWTNATNRTAVSIDRRNLYYALVGNVLGEVGSPADYEYAITSGWNGSANYRLGFPDMGNDGFSGTYPPNPIPSGDGGPRDLYCDRDDTTYGTTIIEGNWTSVAGAQDWTITPEPIPASLFLAARPVWFGNLAWPPVDPANPVTDDPTIIPAGYRYVHGTDPPPVTPPDDGGAPASDGGAHDGGTGDGAPGDGSPSADGSAAGDGGGHDDVGGGCSCGAARDPGAGPRGVAWLALALLAGRRRRAPRRPPLPH